MSFIKKEKYALILLLINILSLAFAWILQLFFDMEPCSLCLLQRFGLYISASILIVYLIINLYKSINWLNIILSMMSLIGILFSFIAGLRQTYIQSLPFDQIPSCGADLNTLLQVVTPLEAIKKVFQGSGECADKALVVMGLSLANWATIIFFTLLIIQVVMIIKQFKKK